MHSTHKIDSASPTQSAPTLPRRMWRRALALEQHTVIITLAFLCLFALNFLCPTDPDFWWHLRTGQLIAETGAVPQQDVFSYTALGKPWVAHEWLAELIMYGLYAGGGYVADVAFFSLVITLAYFVVYLLLRRLGVDKTLTTGLILFTIVVRLALWPPRPQLFTFLLFAVYLYVLFSHKQFGRARLWLLPPLMVLWVNMHAGYVIGLFLIGLFVIGELLNRLTHRPAADLKPLFLAGVASALAALINPNTYIAWLYPFTYAGSGNASMRFIAEWQSPDFHDYLWLPFALAIALLMILGPARRIDFTYSALVLCFTVMALQSVRHIVLFALVAAPILALRFKERGISISLKVKARSSMVSALNLLLLVAVPVLLLVVVLTSPVSQAHATPSTESYPVGGVAYLREHRPAGNLLNTYGWGGYLIYSLYPEYRVFIDGRADVYGDELMEEYMQMNDIGPRWREVLDRHQVAVALVEKEARLAVLLETQPDWRLAYEGEVEKIFVRDKAP